MVPVPAAAVAIPTQAVTPRAVLAEAVTVVVAAASLAMDPLADWLMHSALAAERRNHGRCGISCGATAVTV